MKTKQWDYLAQLQLFANYRARDQETDCDNCKPIQFCQYESNNYLNSFRNKYGLDRFITGNDDQTARGIMRWVFEVLLHSNYAENTIQYDDSNDMIAKSKKSRVTLNCYCHAYILRDALQSAGIVSRLVYCLPLNCDFLGNHVVVEYYSNNLKQWVLADPTYNINLVDDHGGLLDLVTFRKRIINQELIFIVDNNRFVENNNRSRNQTLAGYINMMVPILVVLQYESTVGYHIHNYRLIPDKYLIPSQQINTESMSYIYSFAPLYGV